MKNDCLAAVVKSTLHSYLSKIIAKDLVTLRYVQYLLMDVDGCGQHVYK